MIGRLKIQKKGGAAERRFTLKILFVMSFGGDHEVALKGHRVKGNIPQCEVRT